MKPAPAVRPRRFLEQHQADARALADIVETYLKIGCKLAGAAVVAWAAACVIGGRSEELDPWLVAGGGGTGALLWLFSRLSGVPGPVRPRVRRRN